jgi:hypothetical protein
LWIVPANPSKLVVDVHESNLALTASSHLKIPQPLRVTTDKNRIILDLSPPEDAPDQDICIEILEARETAPLWKDIDLAITRKQKASLSLATSSLSPYSILTRIAAMPELAKSTNNPLKIDLNDFQSQTITSGIGAALIFANDGRAHDLVKLTSIILRTIAEKFGDLNQHAPLRNVLPELLGDQWSKVDPKLAFKSWKTAILVRGNNPRILRKIAKLAQDTGDFTLEFDTLIEKTLFDWMITGRGSSALYSKYPRARQISITEL